MTRLSPKRVTETAVQLIRNELADYSAFSSSTSAASIASSVYISAHATYLMDCIDRLLYPEQQLQTSIAMRHTIKQYRAKARRALKADASSNKVILWLETLDNGSAKKVLADYGLGLCEFGNIRVVDTKVMLRSIMQNIILPALEKECGLTNIKVKSDAKILSRSLLDFSNVQFKSNSKTQ